MEKKSPPYEFQVSLDATTQQEYLQFHQSQPKNLYSKSWRRRQIQKLLPQIRRRVQGIEQVYDPMMVSIGPYHHGKPEFHRAEEFKHLCLDRLAGSDDKKKAFFYSKILNEISVIRDSYEEAEIIEKYDNESLELMMLLDGSMIIDYMHNYTGMKGSSFSAWERCLGVASVPLMFRDMVLMENQIPFRVVKLLISLQYEREESELFVSRFVSKRTGITELKHFGIPQEEEDPPIHLLDVFLRFLVRIYRSKTIISLRDDNNGDGDGDGFHAPPRSVMDLKAKGIHVRPNSTRSVGNITLSRNVCFSQLYLPVQVVSTQTPAIWSNAIAFEVFSDSRSNPIMLSHMLFLKSLIQTPEDVKELQEKGVILNRLANLEKVVELFREIDTFGLHDLDVFKEVRMEIEEHCRSRARTWVAELIYTRFRTPWTAMALLGPLFFYALLLCRRFTPSIL